MSDPNKSCDNFDQQKHFSPDTMSELRSASQEWHDEDDETTNKPTEKQKASDRVDNKGGG